MNLSISLPKVRKIIQRILSLNHVSGKRIYHLKPLERIGTDYGGWVIPKNYLRADSICYCVGAGEDISFDVGITVKYGCDVYIFDPTPRAAAHFERLKAVTIRGGKMPINNNATEFYNLEPSILERIHYFAIGIWDRQATMKFYAPQNSSHVSHSILNLQKTEDFFEARVNSLSNIMKMLKHKKIDLLKLDIEGAEYKVIDSIISDNLDIGVLCIEFDELRNRLDDNYLIRIKDSLIKLTNFGFLIVNIDRKSNYTFIRRKL